ncbi:MAG: T9SS type A sorting domain-containing protein [Cyclobacteriaceae bacterium]
MKMKELKTSGYRAFFFLMVFLCGESADAQFSQLPLIPSPSKEPADYSQRRLDDLLVLPFWDDFSNGQIDDSKWEPMGVTGSMSIGINPPSAGMVLLDGIDENGNPYSRTVLENGEGDQLISKPLDLSNIEPESSNTVYLSFYWQAGGKGEMPDAIDELVLYFLDADGNWNRVWEQAGGDEVSNDSFEQVLIPVRTPYHYAGFRFKFQHMGRLSGPFDTWVLDYIYFNSKRNPDDFFSEDRALTKLPSSPFGKFGAIPFFEFSEELLVPVESQFNNLSNRFRAMEFTVNFKDHENGTVLENLNADTPFNPVPQALERRDFGSRSLASFSDELDAPFDLETEVYLSTGDGFLVDDIQGNDTTFQNGVDFRLNDTVRNIVSVRDFFSYDQGFVDYSAGINQRGGMLALEYEVSQETFVSGVSINFTNYLQRGNGLELMVWDSLQQEPVYRKEVLIPADSSPEGYSYFPIDTNIRVSDRFYVGFTQFTNDFIHVGLDKSGDSGEHIFYNVLGEWEQNQEVSGNLMIRPHLSLAPPAEVPIEEEAEIKYYPNPVIDRLYIEGEVSELMVYDFQGRVINVQKEGETNLRILNFAHNQRGIYLIKYLHQDRPKTIRILVK